MKYLILAATIFIFGSFSFSQTLSDIPALGQASMKKLDSLEIFHHKIDTILQSQNDSIQSIDSTVFYRLLFVAKCPFNLLINEDDYLDEECQLCTQHVYQSDTTIQVKFIHHETHNAQGTAHMKLPQDSLIFYSYVNNEKGDQFIPFEPSFYDVFSFLNGHYLIIHTRIFGPDIRDSMPPGLDTTFYLEKL